MENELKNDNNKKWWIIVIIIATVIGIIIVINILSLKVRLDNEKLIINGPFYTQTVLYSQIDTVEIRENVDYGMRVLGADYIGIKTGKFLNDEFKNYSLSVCNSTTKVIVIRKKDGNFLLFNVKGNDATIIIYNQLTEKLV